jgi:hypothetical protein
VAALAVVLAINLGLAFATNVDTEVTEADEVTFTTILNLERPTARLEYEAELALISRVQRLVLAKAPDGEGVPEYQRREPADLFRFGSGSCYDRSRTFDKLFAWLGFETRHVFLVFSEDPVTSERTPVWRSLVTSRSPSHAVTEVKTKAGWLVVDSNSAWISLNVRQEPVPAEDIGRRLHEFADVPAYFRTPHVAIRGLYSRRGQLYPPFIPYPDVNWRDFWSGAAGYLTTTSPVPRQAS